MHLFVSDLHLGRHAPEFDREVERDLIGLLRSVESEVARLYLLGDVFDYFIEYRSVIPRGSARLQGLLAEWSDAGIPITYLVGNHDPWHDDYFETELGVRLEKGAIRDRLGARGVYLAHGDRAVPHGFIRRTAERLLRHPIPVWLYKSLLPADIGIFLARESSRVLGTGAPVVRPEVVEALRRFARQELQRPDTDLVVLAHTHYPEIVRWPFGDYINTGCWFRDRTFARLDERGVNLCRWRGGQVEVMAPEASGVLI